MIVSFRCRKIERFFVEAKCPAEWRSFEAVAARKLIQLHTARDVRDLQVPPGNRLEGLKGDRAGQWSIRLNQKWRICFHWGEHGPEDVELVDYH